MSFDLGPYLALHNFYPPLLVKGSTQIQSKGIRDHTSAVWSHVVLVESFRGSHLTGRFIQWVQDSFFPVLSLEGSCVLSLHVVSASLPGLSSRVMSILLAWQLRTPRKNIPRDGT